MAVASFQIPAYEVQTDHSLRALAGQTRTVFLGRNPSPGGPTLRLRNYFAAGDRVPPPEAVSYSEKALKSIRLVYGNDAQGDCVIASGLHALGLWSGNDSDSGGILLGTTQEALSEYHRIGGPGDNGLDQNVALEDFRRTGLLCGGKRYRIDGYAGIDTTDIEEVKVAIILLGGGRIGFNVPSEWMNNVVEGAVWDTPSRLQFVGGHDVRLVSFNKVGVQVSTWGLIVTITWRAFTDRRIVDAGYVELSPNWYGNDQLAPSGFKSDALKSDITLIANGTIPAWQPAPVPPPVPPVPPTPPVPPVSNFPNYDGTVTIFGMKCPIHLTPSATTGDHLGVAWFSVIRAALKVAEDVMAQDWQALILDIEALVSAFSGNAAALEAHFSREEGTFASAELGVAWLALFRDVKALVSHAQAGADFSVLLEDAKRIAADLGFQV